MKGLFSYACGVWENKFGTIYLKEKPEFAWLFSSERERKEREREREGYKINK